MADPDAPWEFEDTPEEPPQPPPEAPAEESGAAPPAEGEPPSDEFPPPPGELSEAEQKKKYLCRHWIRPKFLQYNYIYNYRKNYYDDIIDYLDKRSRGLFMDKPRAQTWAERALRTYTHNLDRSLYLKTLGVRLQHENRLRKQYVNTFHAEHSHDYYHRKYKSVLY